MVNIFLLKIEFAGIFYIEGDKLTFTKKIKYCIDTQNAKPIFTKPYRYPQIHKKEVKRNSSDLFDQLEKCEYFTLDLANGFHHIEINLSDVSKQLLGCCLA